MWGLGGVYYIKDRESRSKDTGHGGDDVLNRCTGEGRVVASGWRSVRFEGPFGEQVPAQRQALGVRRGNVRRNGVGSRRRRQAQRRQR